MSLTKEIDILYTKGIGIAERILSHQDNNIASPSYGLFGRSHWSWKMTPMPDAANQYAIYYLSLIWSIEKNNNIYFKNSNILQRIIAGIKSWIQLQKPDGSFDQVYYNEHSVGATSYTLLGVLETKEILKDAIPTSLNESLNAAIQKSGKFLLSNDESYGMISNHLALFAYTFHKLWRSTNDVAFNKKCKKLLNIIIDNMSEEGWFPEYEGADPGYQTQCLHYLSKLELEGYSELKIPIENTIRNFLPYFIHPDGSFGGNYGSRNTSIVYPGGFILLLSKYVEAFKIVKLLYKGINSGSTPTPNFLDFPNAIRLASNYLSSWHYASSNSKVVCSNDFSLPCELKSCYKEFPEAGLLSIGTEYYYIVICMKKSGVFKLFDKKSRKLVRDDRGYFGELKKYKITSQIFFNSNYTLTSNKLVIKHPLFYMNLPSMSFYKYFFLSFLCISFFRFKIFRELFNKVMVKHLITFKKRFPGHLLRTFEFSEKVIIVKNYLKIHDKNAELKIMGEGNFSTVHMASSNYFDTSQILNKNEFTPSTKTEFKCEFLFPYKF